MAPTRRGRLVCYGLGALAATALLKPAFVPGPYVAIEPPSHQPVNFAAPAAAGAAALLVSEDAWAKEGVWGPLEGKASSLVHPSFMALLFLVTLYTGYLGVQWRQTRLIGVEIADLRKQLPKEEDAEAVMSAAQRAIKAQITDLTSQRSDLIKGQFKDRHFQISSLLLGSGIFFTCYGVFNTYFRADKLFPGPHLFAGAGICVCWAIAAACVPFMEKGNEFARTLHIGLNVLMLGLFAWQLTTGFDILLKVWGNDKLPWF